MSYGSTPLPDSDERERGDVIVLADASVEGEDIASILRARGFVVFDVPLALLEARVASEDPRILMVDVDAPQAIEKIERIRSTPAGKRAELFCLGDPLRAAELVDVSLTDNVFERPVDIQRLVDRTLTVANPAFAGFGARGTTPPPMYPVRPSAGPPPESIPPISDFPRAQDPLDVGSFLDEGADPATSLGILAGGQVRLSPELARQILEAEERVRGQVENPSSLPPSEDADCPVPPEMLAQLEEPLDASDDAEGTGGLAAALANPGSSSGGSSALPALTPAPRIGSRTGITPAPEPAIARGKHGTSQVLHEEPPLTGADLPPGTIAQPSVGRLATPAMGVRLGELLGLRPEEIKRETERKTGAGLAALQLPALDVTERGDELLVGPSHPEGATLSPLSPPVRFQEPRDIAEGRAVFDLRSVPPRGDTPRAAPSEPRTATARDAMSMGSPPAPYPSVRDGRSASAREDEGVSPAAASVRPQALAAKPEATTQGAFESPSAMGPALSLGGAALVFGEGEGLRPLARAIAGRTSGCLSFATAEGTRRIVLMDGDLVTASSEIANESLIAFLAGRGDLDRDVAARLAGKLPPSGRHAGAALIAQGHLAQGDLWPVLRAHAQWLIGKVLLTGPGSCEAEDDLPGRLKAEPNVFGGATGAEVFVETARRVLEPARSLAALDPAARVDWGARKSLLSECALSGDDDARIRGGTGKTIGELCQGQEPDFASVARALVELEVLSVIAPPRRSQVAPRGPDPIDEDAIRQRVRAKMVLVQEGDYFSLLGVGRDATSYEIKRAFLELRRTFDPHRLLTAGTADLHADVVLILEVIEEAFEILRDDRRRDRYRRAIEAGPPD